MGASMAFRIIQQSWLDRRPTCRPDPWTSSNPISCGLVSCGPRAMNEFAFQEIGLDRVGEGPMKSFRENGEIYQ